MADQNLATVLHHWEGVSTEETTGTPSLAIRTSLSLNSLQHIRGFRDLGTCWLPGTEVTDETRVHNHFTSLIPEDDGGKKSLEVSSDADIISRILKRVRNTPSSPQDVPIQLFAISVLSNNGTGALFTGGPFPLWKWVKPESVYSEFSLRGVLASNWETDMEKLIAKGEWTAGKDLQLLLRGVSEERGEEHSASNDRWKTITDIWRCG
ncbi:hypothetical protein FQN54_000077 [Arachnomyces sp. PD_36]|nr:hypothetical protein FQN54_000077 [Arachnomyces sp. PD_36]